MDLLKVPIEGLMSLLGGFTGGGGGRRHHDDPLDPRNLQRVDRGRIAVTLDQVIRQNYDNAKESLCDESGQLLPLRNSFLYGTWISYYKCEFHEVEPHVVRWVDINHPLVTFFHWHQLTVQVKCLDSVVRPYGRIVLYAENDVQRFLDYLVGFCGECGLPLAELRPKSETEQDDEQPEAGAVNPEEDGFIDVTFHEDGQDSQSSNYDREMDIYINRVYQEILMTQSDPRRGAPRYQDIFYNMSCTVIRINAHETRKYWWMDSKHAFLGHPLMDGVRPVDRFNATHGRCSVYEDSDVQQVADALWREFSRRNLEIEVKPIQMNGHSHILGGAQPPRFSNEEV